MNRQTLIVVVCWMLLGWQSQALFAQGGGGSSPSWQIAPLDTAGGLFPETRAEDVNATGIVAGFVVDPSILSGSTLLAACWLTAGTTSQLLLLNDGTHAFSVNNFGAIVGAGEDAAGSVRGRYWSDLAAEPLILPPLLGDNQSWAYAVNNQRVICGHSSRPITDPNGNPGYIRTAVAWRIVASGSELSVVGPIALPSSADCSEAYALANSDSAGAATVVGEWRTVFRQRLAAVRWTVRAPADGSLSVDPNPVVLELGDATAAGVNDQGVVCGERKPSARLPFEARVWSSGTAVTLNKGGKAATTALDLNTQAMIVGYGGTGVIDHDAMVWTSPTAKPILLNKFLQRKNPPFAGLREARAVNSGGTIVGIAWDGVRHAAFLAVPK